MTVKTQKQADGSFLVVECDNCGEEFETQSNEFREAIGAARGAGWRPLQEEGRWKHYCPDCK